MNIHTAQAWMVGQDLGRLCLDLASATSDHECVHQSLAFLCEQHANLKRMAIFLFDEHFAPVCHGAWPEHSLSETMQILDDAIDCGAVAEAMHHGRYAIDHPQWGAFTVRAIGTRGKDLGLFLGFASHLEHLAQPQIEGIVTPTLAILSQALENLRLRYAAQSQAEALQQAVDKRTQELSLALQASQAAERSKSVFLATMSHEIRTPLNGILGVLDLLNGQLGDPDHDELIGTARHSAQHLLSLLNDILDLAKIDAGRTQVSDEQFDIVELVDGIITSLSSHDKVRNGAVRLDLSCQLRGNPQRQGDSVHVRQILFNLIGNALKFTHHGRVEVLVTDDGDQSDRTTPNNDWIRLAVRDTGIGISVDDQRHIFDPFQQAGHNTHTDYGGTGLGLAISHRLALFMGGSLNVESTPGVGSTFTVRLPLALGNSAYQKPDKASDPVVPRQVNDQPLAGLRILAAEDNPVNRIVLRRMLDRLGCSVALAEDGEAAWHLYQQSSPDLVLTDIEMPHLDGYGLAMRIREHEQTSGAPPIPIIALSAHTFAEHQHKATSCGINHFIAKPVMLNDLRNGLLAAQSNAFHNTDSPSDAEDV